MKRLIVTGDDFGLAVCVNEAIEQAHREGILTAASLMVGADAAADAVARARRLPTLRVGLHVVLVEGRPVLPPEQVPDLVDERGELSRHLVRAGFNYFFRRRVKDQLEAEIRAQFEAFRATGLPLDHANAHNHMHLHPSLLALIVSVGREFGLRAVRVPYEPPLLSWRAARPRPPRRALERSPSAPLAPSVPLAPAVPAAPEAPAAAPRRPGLAGRVLSSSFLAPWTSLLRRRLRQAGLKSNQFTFGLYDSGNIDGALLERLLAGLPEGVTEIYLHPATRRSPELDRHMPTYRHEAELAALTSRGVIDAVSAGGIRRIAFSDLEDLCA